MSPFDLSGYLSRTRKLVDAALINVFDKFDRQRELVQAMTQGVQTIFTELEHDLALAPLK